jgi:hypothetical protein
VSPSAYAGGFLIPTTPGRGGAPDTVPLTSRVTTANEHPAPAAAPEHPSAEYERLVSERE